LSVEEITPEQAAVRLEELYVVDVRGADEFDGPLGHILGARLVPLDALEGRFRELPGGGPLLLVCRSGHRSALACTKLAKLGCADAINLAGGMIAWNEAGLPVATGHGEQSV
jgi:rhodanese-related sulfurtransferase